MAKNNQFRRKTSYADAWSRYRELADRYGKLMNDIDAELKANDDRFTPKIDKMIDECIALIDEQDKARLALSL